MGLLKTVIGLASGALGLHYYKLNLDAQFEEQRQALEKERQAYIDELAKKDKIINPNGDANTPPVTIVGAVHMGGLTLNMVEIELTIKNTSSIQVELEDWRCELSVGGIKSLVVIPSNIAGIIIPAGQTRTFRLYARGQMPFPRGLYNSVKDALEDMAIPPRPFKANFSLPASQKPAELDIAVLWNLEGETQEAYFYNVPCSFTYHYAGWTVGIWTGYNAGKEKQQAKNPSYWTKYDTHDE